MIKDVKRHRFIMQRSHAKARGIAFNFTFEEWCQWWEINLGANWLEMRGRRADQYCMARKGDKGPYSSLNVKCILNSQNHNDRSKNGTARGKAILSDHQVRTIWKKGITDQSKRSLLAKKLGAKYGVGPQSIRAVWRGSRHKRITARLASK